jgi:c-di-GMP-binding flagellar brake protein YcgR
MAMTAPDIEPSNEFAPYTTTDPLEIASILSSLRDRHARASIYFNAQPGSILTNILAVNATASSFVFDLDSDPVRNEALLTGRKLAWQTTVDGVKIEFGTEAARQITFTDGHALEAPMPSSVLRLQRRNAFRAATPTARPISCLIDSDGLGEKEIKTRILDISALGLSLLVDTTILSVADRKILPRVRIELPGFGEIRCGMEIRYAIDPGRRFPSHYRRCGVQFKELAAADQVLIQRYIISLERERAKSRAEAD